MDIFSGLNPQQIEAVRSTEGYIRVIAGAGSGKTRALAHRFAYLVNELGILPSNILCVTFSNKSAAEMKKRIRSLLGDNDTGYISTFHSFCVSVLQEDISAVSYPKNFIVLDNPDIDRMLAIIYEERSLSMRDRTFSSARDMIEIRKTFTMPLYYEYMLSLSLDELREKYLSAQDTDDIIFWGYVYQEKKCFALDYNDLINFVIYIFDSNEAVRLKWQDRLEYIMIDEYQDIDDLQYRLMRKLCPGHNNLFIVGDPDQTIYTWRGASVRYILDFEKDFPNVKTIMMMSNYRSTPQIINAANTLISANEKRIKKDLIPTLPDGEKPIYSHLKTNADEANWIADKIRELEAGGVKLSDCAVLYRAHYVSRALEDVFIARELPYTLYSGTSFFDRAEIKDALAYLRMIVFRDDLSFLRIVNTPKRNIGQRRLKALQEYSAEHGTTLYEALVNNADTELFANTKAKKFISLVENFADNASMQASELLSLVLDASGYEAALRLEGSQIRLDNLAELKQAVHEYETSNGEESSAEDFLMHAALLNSLDLADSKNAVKLMTVHTAKGLEFKNVFLCGLNEGIFPSRKTKSQAAMEEERRLAFVAVTRAKERLFLSDAEGRNLDGSYRYPSRFIFNAGRDNLTYTTELDAGLVSEALGAISLSESSLSGGESGPLFKPGDKIRHEIMGRGEIVDIDMDKSAYIIKYDALPTTRRISFKAKLSRD